MAGRIDTAIYQTSIATPGHPRRSRAWITGKLFEYLEWLCIKAGRARGSSSFLCRYLWFVICWLLLLSPPVPRVVLASPPALTCHVVTRHRQVSLVTWPGTDPSSPGYGTGLTLAGIVLKGVILLSWPKKCLMREGWSGVRFADYPDYQPSFVLAPAANTHTHSPHTRSFTKVSAIHILLLIKTGRQRQDNALSSQLSLTAGTEGIQCQKSKCNKRGLTSPILYSI